MRHKRDSPHFSKVLFWIKSGALESLRDILDPADARADLERLRAGIYSELTEPLFLRIGIVVSDEDDCSGHKKTNLICCLEYHLRKLKHLIDNENSDAFDRVLKQFQRDYGLIIERANRRAKSDPLFYRIFDLDTRNPNESIRSLQHTLEAAEKEKRALEQSMRYFPDSPSPDNADDRMRSLWEEWNDSLNKVSELREKIDRLRFEDYERKKEKVKIIAERLSWLRRARGKPGRHPKPFNVFTYHLINRCTFRKINQRNRRAGIDPYIRRKDGQYKLERNWQLVLYLLLETHLKKARIPEIDEFIKAHSSAPAHDALRTLKNKLWNSYKNFPPLEGWPFQRQQDENEKTSLELEMKALSDPGPPDSGTGFRKLIVQDSGGLQVVRL